MHFKKSSAKWHPFCLGLSVLKTACGLFFAGEVSPRLARHPLKTNGRLANRELASLVEEATGSNNAQRALTITLIIVRIVCGVC